MKKIILLVLIFAYTFSYAQDTKFVYGEGGLVPRHFVIDLEGMNKDDLFTKAEEWFEKKYYGRGGHDKKGNDGDKKTEKGRTTTILSYEVVKDEPEATGKTDKNIKLRFIGFTDNALCFGTDDNYTCVGLEYKVELRFRDGDYRFKPMRLSFKTSSSKKEQNINLNKHKFKGKDGVIQQGYEEVSSQVETLLNDMNKSILNHLTGKEQEDEW